MNGVNGVPAFQPAFDVVIANILFVVLQKIIPELARITRKDGMLILSGVLVEDAEEMTRLAGLEGLRLLDQGQQDGWACLTFAKITGCGLRGYWWRIVTDFLGPLKTPVAGVSMTRK